MRQRLNYTHRKRITLDLVGFRLVEVEDEVRLFTERFQLSSLELPAEATVILILRQAGVFEVERISCGTVGDLRPPAGSLSRVFSSAAGVRIRVEVVGVSGENRGLILAHAPDVRPIIEAPGNSDLERIPLLPFVPSDGLGSRLWVLDLDDAGGPSIQVNRTIGNWRSLVRSESFQLLVFPEITQQIARWYLIAPDDEVEDHGPLAQWSVFFENLEPGVRSDRPDDDDEVSSWAAGRSWQLADRLGQRMDLLERSLLLLEDEEK